MCYTATQVVKAYELQSFYTATIPEQLPDSEYYKADGFTHPSLIVLNGNRELKLMQWGLIPIWAKADAAAKLSNSTLNAKSETVRTLPSFKGSIGKNRCIIPVNSFFEYKHLDGDKLPYCIHPKEQPFFNLAGIYSNYKQPDGNWISTFSILTQPANVFMADIHNSAKRMPMMLSNNLIDDWINPSSPASMIDDIMQYACDDSSLAAYRVRRDLKKAPNDSSVLLGVSEQPEIPSNDNLLTL